MILRCRTELAATSPILPVLSNDLAVWSVCAETIRVSPFSPPHATHARTDIDPHSSCIRPAIGSGGGNGPRRTFEELQQYGGDEAGARGIDMPVTLSALSMGEEALGNDKMQIVLRAGHPDIE